MEVYLKANKKFFNKRRRVLENEKNYLHFSLQKRNIDTISAINFIAKFFKRTSKRSSIRN